MEIEKKWQERWEENKTFVVENESNKPKFYVLDMFPYPSGSGLHVGHPLGYIASDIMARYKRQEGFNVLHPMGFDSFGLPAEQYALSKGIHPAISMHKNIKRYRNQLKQLGFSYDWSREVKTSDPNFYKWTQYIFTLLFNHWYDEKLGKARSIESLVGILEKRGNIDLEKDKNHRFTTEEWNAMNRKEQADELMNYRLAYRKKSYVNWCEGLGTVLANDEVINGVSERGGFPVVKKPMMQWSLRITAYADRLLEGLKTLEWSDSLKTQQENWVGKSTGAKVTFQVASSPDKIDVFTTRPDTIYGVSFMVLAPEHPLVNKITPDSHQKGVMEFQDYASKLSEIERMQEKKVSGQFTGAYALHPITQDKIPIYISDYVLADYGTGAIMAVPGDDERDKRFAVKFNIPIIEIIDRSEFPESSMGDRVGTLMNSDILDGLKINRAIEKMIEHLEDNNLGYAEVSYKLRDANFSRQRYWGEPFPILYNNESFIAESLPEEALPLELPDLKLSQIENSKGKAPLSILDRWVHEIDGYTREVDTMPGYAGSSWYFLRYMDPENEEAMFSEDAVNYWQDVDFYVGGTEHAVGHLIYARFWHKFLYDLDYVPTEEPFKKLVNQGMINGRSLLLEVDNPSTGKRRLHVPIKLADENDFIDSRQLEELAEEDNRFQGIDFENEITWVEQDGTRVVKLIAEIEKMSKSKYNVVNPEEVINLYGTDCFRLYEMFLGPVEDHKPWDTQGISGVSKFLNKLWSLFYNQEGKWLPEKTPPTDDELKILHKCIKQVINDIKSLSFNTCVSAFMIAVNDLRKLDSHSQEVLEDLIKLMAPFTPHLCEELWEKCGHDESISRVPFPVFQEKYTRENVIAYPLCVNGKKRTEVEFSADLDKKAIEAEAVKNEDIQKWIEGKEIKRVIVVPKRMVNIVV